MKLNEAISRRLTQLLDEKKITAYGLFIKSGVSQSTISDLKKMNNDGVNIRILYELCDGLEISLRDFFDSPLFSRENITD
jgi:DNA-binding Xre family transcriptional regulator